MEPDGNSKNSAFTSTSQASAAHDISRDQLQKRLERFKRKINKKTGDMSGRTTPTSSIGGPPSEYGRALSTVSVPAIRHHQMSNSNVITENASLNRDALPDNDNDPAASSRAIAARVQLVKSLMIENENLKATLDKWAPAVSAYRTCHALVQDLSKKVEEKDAIITQMNNSVKDNDQRGNDSKLKLVEYERRIELKDAALNQLKSKVIELKSQLETAQLAEQEVRRQLGDRSRVLDQLQRGGNTQMQNQQQQAAMAMMNMQLQREMSECMNRLRQRDQELAALTSERDGLAEACNQLQQALQAAASVAVAPISMEMSFKPPPVALSDRQTQTETAGPMPKQVLPNADAHFQTDQFSLPNCSSVLVQFSSIDLQPVVVDLPPYEHDAFVDLRKGDNRLSINLVDSECQWSGSESDSEESKISSYECSVQCVAAELIEMCDVSLQTDGEKFSEFIGNECEYEQSIDISTTQPDSSLLQTRGLSVECQAGTHSRDDMATQTVDPVAVCDSATDPHLTLCSESETQTEVASALTHELQTQTSTTALTTVETSCDDLVYECSFADSTQTDLLMCSDVATDPAHSMFSSQHVFVQCSTEPNGLIDVQCQTDLQPTVNDDITDTGVTVATQSDVTTSSNVGSDPILYRQHAEIQASYVNCSDTGTDPDHSLFTLPDECIHRGNEDHVVPLESASIGCQAMLLGRSHSERPESPTSESVMSLTSDCFSTNLNAVGGVEMKTPIGVLCPTEMDALRAAVRLLSREKRELQSRLAYLSKSPKHDAMKPTTPLSIAPGASPSPSRLTSVSTPSPSSADTVHSSGVHSSLSAIQRRITELREQLAAANKQAHS